ncbi:holin [Streptomyces cucumeris]|uniref:holin n=1 Tax=Streptomyces cucumeris TaxID=2962890 RepID=UPI0020C8B1A0|nr:holin [Streptomyces sp. NEAU-Y11]MCP9205489.1 holin [Streptomyces sp. NEAU-Y11]
MADQVPVEAKVKAATTATFLVSLVLAVLNSVAADESLLDPLPGWLQVITIALVPPGVTFLSGWQARHTPRGPAGL